MDRLHPSAGGDHDLEIAPSATASLETPATEPTIEKARNTAQRVATPRKQLKSAGR